ncbi:hypothetical protein HJFPF1_10083 [Paramyrothecium foliicola]|nr:hypothetical protein HJFPF1_10083 [Paramyrothecium foliicola]
MAIRSQSWKLVTEPEVVVPDGLHPVPNTTPCAGLDSSLEVALPGQDHKSTAVYHETDLLNRAELSSTPDRDSKNEPAGLSSAPKSWRERRVLLIAAAAVVIIIIGGILGGVFGSKALRSADDAQNASPPSGPTTAPAGPSSTSSSTPAPMHTLKSIAANSPLAVAPLVWEGGYPRLEVLLAFLSPDGHLRYVSAEPDIYPFNQGNASLEGWSFLKELDPSLRIDKNAPLQFSSLETLVSLIYTDSESRINGWQLDSSLEGGLVNFSEDRAMGKRNITIGPGGIVGTFGTLRVYQAADGDLSITAQREDCSTGNMTYTPPKSLKVSALQGTKLAIMPLDTYESYVQAGAVGVFYQDEESKIKIFRGSVGLLNNTDPEEVSNSEIDGWVSKGFPDITLPKGHNFAAFLWKTLEEMYFPAVVLLYQDENGDIRQATNSGEGQWHMSSPKALAGADPGTDITCVIKQIRTCWRGKEIELSGTVAGRFQRADFYRCFFWRNSAVVEVRASPTVETRPGAISMRIDWVEIGPVNLL